MCSLFKSFNPFFSGKMVQNLSCCRATFAKLVIKKPSSKGPPIFRSKTVSNSHPRQEGREMVGVDIHPTRFGSRLPCPWQVRHRYPSSTAASRRLCQYRMQIYSFPLCLSFWYSCSTILSVMPVPPNVPIPWPTRPIPHASNTKTNHGNPSPANHQTPTRNRLTTI